MTAPEGPTGPTAPDLSPEDVAAVSAAEEAAEAREVAEEEAQEPTHGSRWTAAPTDRLWPISPEDKALHAAGLVVHIALREIRAEEAEGPGP